MCLHCGQSCPSLTTSQEEFSSLISQMLQVFQAPPSFSTGPRSLSRASHQQSLGSFVMARRLDPSLLPRTPSLTLTHPRIRTSSWHTAQAGQPWPYKQNPCVLNGPWMPVGPESQAWTPPQLGCTFFHPPIVLAACALAKSHPRGLGGRRLLSGLPGPQIPPSTPRAPAVRGFLLPFHVSWTKKVLLVDSRPALPACP